MTTIKSLPVDSAHSAKIWSLPAASAVMAKTFPHWGKSWSSSLRTAHRVSADRD